MPYSYVTPRSIPSPSQFLQIDGGVLLNLAAIERIVLDCKYPGHEGNVMVLMTTGRALYLAGDEAIRFRANLSRFLPHIEVIDMAADAGPPAAPPAGEEARPVAFRQFL